MSTLRNLYYRVCCDSGVPFSRPATDNGNPLTGSPSMNVNGSVTPVEFYYQPPTNQVLFFKQFSVIVGDSGAPAITNYGDVAGPLTNGMDLFIEKNGVKINLSTPIKTNSDLLRLSRCYNIFNFDPPTRIISFIDLLNEYSDGFFIDGSKNEKIGVRINDDLSSLIVHEGQIKGTLKTIII